MILVTGATGNVGGELIRLLCAGGAPTRALVHTPERADTLRGYDCEVAVADMRDAEAMDDAVRGVEAVLLLTRSGPDLPELERNVLDAVLRAGGARVVKLAAIGYDTGGFGRIVDVHTRAVEQLRASGLPHTVLAPNDFMQNLLAVAALVQERGVLAQPRGDAAVGSIDARDVAQVAAHVLASDAHDGASYLLTGPEALTGADVAARLSAELGREVTYVDADPDEVRGALQAAGLDDWYVAGLLELAEAYRAGRASTVTDEVEKATGQPGRRVEQFIRDHRRAFA